MWRQAKQNEHMKSAPMRHPKAWKAVKQ
jgi:hypothetical protein